MATTAVRTGVAGSVVRAPERGGSAGGMEPPSPDPADEARWTAVLARDPLSDGRFVFAVRTTGVYCRPSCPARRPRRAHVRFFASAAGAERAGYRPCRRCRPQDPAPDAAALLHAVRAAIAQHPGGRLTTADLARHAGVTPACLVRLFRRLHGVTPARYAASLRLERLRAALRSGAGVTDATYAAGFGSASQVYGPAAAERLGMTPAAYRRRGAGAHIAYTVGTHPLGAVLLAATPRGICAVSLGDDAAALEASLRAEFPAAALRRDDGALRPWLDEVLRRLDGGRPGADLPLDVRATAFQAMVWQALRAIPPGGTRSYAQIAAAVGRPRSARATGRAIASNPVAVLVPCHRAVHADGSLGGYRWGVERKRSLLRNEARGGAEDLARGVRQP